MLVPLLRLMGTILPQYGATESLETVLGMCRVLQHLRGKVAWSRPANSNQNPCLTDSVRHEFWLEFVFAGLAANVAADGVQIRLEPVFPLGARAPSTMLSGW